MDADIDYMPGTLITNSAVFNTTCKRFEPGRNLIKFPVAHSAPLKYNCCYHSNLKPSSRAAKTHLIETLSNGKSSPFIECS